MTVKRVSLLSDMHLRNIRTKLLLMSRNHEATKHLEVGLGRRDGDIAATPALQLLAKKSNHA